MPPKGEAARRAKESSAPPTSAASTSSTSSQPRRSAPQTVYEQSLERYHQTRPYAKAIETAGLSGLTPADRALWTSAQYLGSTTAASSSSSSKNSRQFLATKAQKELWRHVNEASLPLRALPQPLPPSPPQPPNPTASSSSSSLLPSATASSGWGRDRSGRDVGDYSLDAFRARTARRVRLTALEVAHHAFTAKRESNTAALTADDIQTERQRRADIATLRMELYGQRAGGSYAQDPEWDDVVPVALVEPEGALAAIAYPDAYAEAISYLRAVMTAPEYSPRCLRLTEHVIALNPAHYTVWLYRFAIVNALQLPLADEFDWLNNVALQNLKNYQIWHHRYLLTEAYYPQLMAGAGDDEDDATARVNSFGRREIDFLTAILAEDTKNYHVWSYRQYLVRKLGLWNDDERYATEAFIRQDVRNNSAWSHRFFLVFSDPANSSAPADQKDNNDSSSTGGGNNNNSNTTPELAGAFGGLSLRPDPAVPAAILDREIDYAQERINKAPQNESPWNYLKGVLAKGGRPLASVETFAAQFVANISSDEGDATSDETVKSTHAMDLLAAVYAEQGDTARADLYWRRLAEKWDPIRAGYWQYRRQQLVQ
ncbi:farnesyltransferase alpha subunit ram2 [Niveomyces insectorum RCEF 264]|uniref:Protein farnesyltransferase/geranylgeranyltransferase type-1 subunit alpha n=1 Tax=Niveomyces insectorum RCEF 264 TaxID=1081102 RepID=A0A167MG50_9HYPO|nr:farnesyltransferase alpha subunit ram2 [Niveomyces insectorum RCEF 264]